MATYVTRLQWSTQIRIPVILEVAQILRNSTEVYEEMDFNRSFSKYLRHKL